MKTHPDILHPFVNYKNKNLGRDKMKKFNKPILIGIYLGVCVFAWYIAIDQLKSVGIL